MPITAKLRYLRISPRKVRLVADLIRGKSTEEAQNILHFVTKRASLPFLKLLKSAVSNAENNFHIKEKKLYISKVLVDEGPKLKRWIARARGKANEIQKKTSHITIILNEIEKQGVVKVEAAKKEEEIKEEKGVKKFAKSPKTEKEKLRWGAERPKLKEERRTKKVFRRTAF